MPTELKTENSKLGELQKVYRVKFGCRQIFLFGFILFPWAFFTITMLATQGFILLVFVIPLSAALFLLLRAYLEERHDELRIYENGFTYFQTRKKLQSCLWKEIDHFIRAKNAGFDGVRKKNGEAIYWSTQMPGIDDLTAGECAKFLE